jgi:Fic family protein
MKTKFLMIAVDRYAGQDFIRKLTQKTRPLTEGDVRDIHRVLYCDKSSDAGKYTYCDLCVKIKSGLHLFSPVAEIAVLMSDFGKWLGSAPDNPDTAFEAHRRLVNIHPFVDGNGRTARYLMNIVLIRGEFPPIHIRRPEDHSHYKDLVQEARESEQGIKNFNNLLYDRLDAALKDEDLALRSGAGR